VPAAFSRSRVVVTSYVDVNDGALDDGADVAAIGHDQLGADDPHLNTRRDDVGVVAAIATIACRRELWRPRCQNRDAATGPTLITPRAIAADAKKSFLIP
jgi:hypothetical protein